MSIDRQKRRGFSLTELLFALGVLSIGMVFVAGVFPAGLVFTVESSEQTIARLVAKEAFAKVRLFHIDPCGLVLDSQVDFNDITIIPPYEFEYPTSFDVHPVNRNYYWSALCRPLTLDPNGPVQVTVFVCRRVGGGAMPRSQLVNVGVDVVHNDNLITVTTGDQRLITAGQTIVDNRTGRLYRVNDRDLADDTLVELYGFWSDPGGFGSSSVWVVPPGANSSRNPCVAVHQRLIRF